jgi:hypothetical protein
MNETQTPKEKEFYGELSKAQEILTGLAAIAFLLVRSNEAETDYGGPYWEEFYDKCPWINPRNIPTDGELPTSLKDGLATLIFREAGLAWNKVTRADEIVRDEKRSGKLIWGEPGTPKGGET